MNYSEAEFIESSPLIKKAVDKRSIATRVELPSSLEEIRTAVILMRQHEQLSLLAPP